MTISTGFKLRLRASIRPGVMVWIAVACGAVLLLGLLLPRPGSAPKSAETPPPQGVPTESGAPAVAAMRDRRAAGLLHSRAGSDGSRPPEAVVADKLTSFARGRRDIAQALASRFQVQVPPDVDRFFDAAESGSWDDIKRIYNTLSSQKDGGGSGRDLDVLWPAVQEAYGVAAVAKSWPPKELLDYGESILSSLRPGMVYIAGSDAARYIPTLLAETSGGDRPVILPQNAFAQGNQLDYLGFLHGDHLTGLSREDAQRVFTEVLEQKQSNGAGGGPDSSMLRSSGPVAMAAVNEKLLHLLMERNPGMTFAIEQSVPMEGLNSKATPLGPLMELQANEVDDATRTAKSTDALGYWRETAQKLQADTSLPVDSPSRTAYAQMVASQAAVFAERNQPLEAEQAYRFGVQMAPASMEAVSRLSQFLVKTGRQAEALQAVEDFAAANESMRSTAEDLRKTLMHAPDTLH